MTMLSDTDCSPIERAGSDTANSDEQSTASTPWSMLSGSPIDLGDNGGPLEPIAIIGMGCRLPGAATDPSSLWDMLVSGRTAWTPGPGTRFNLDAFKDPTGKKVGTTNTCGGHWIREDIAAFDAAFFGINPVEAVAMDPQQRILLEIAYESFQNAGLSTDSLWGSDTGVFVGQWTSDYHEIVTRDVERPPLYLVMGTGPAISSNRISYYFNLRGPSFTVDTGCSSSFVALHQAVQSLRAGETSQCFVGGVNLVADPQRLCYQSGLKMFSDEGRSFAFDSRANGYGRGEGCTGVVLKPLSAAVRDGNHIRALIRNSVLNQDGRTPGISVPSAAAQREAIIKAYRQAGLEVRADYVEAHGTGTKVGDPIEVSAIAAALSSNKTGTPLRRRMPIGSIKGNIGHTEGAAGLAGLIKAVLMLEHGAIPPQANYEKGNPDIPLEEWNLTVPRQLERQNLRRISVNSFGYGGTNAHVVVDAAGDLLDISSLSRLSVRGEISSYPAIPRLFTISAASERSCQRMCKRLAKYLVTKHRNSSDPDTILARLAYTLSKHSWHARRVTIVASGLDDLVAQLCTTASSAIPGRQDKSQSSRVAFVFSGQGAQYAEMGRQLLHRYPSFFHSLERANQHLARLRCPWDLLSELCRPKAESRVNEPACSQPLSTAIQLALVNLLAEFGILPSAVVGHSSGEIAAAYAAGLISFEDAITVAYFRGRLAGELIAKASTTPGAMLAVGATPAAIEEIIANIGAGYGRMRIACFNSPSSVTVSGDATAIDQLHAVLDADGTFNRKLMTNGAAYHSHQMGLMEKEYAQVLAKLRPTPPASASTSIRMVSSVTGLDVEDQSMLDGTYWARNLLSPVLFSQALKVLCEQQYDGHSIDTIVEVGPHSQLAGPVKQILKTLSGDLPKIKYTHTLKRGSNAEVSLLHCLGSLLTQGAPVRVQGLHSNRSSSSNSKPTPPPLLVDLPPYPFDHDRTFWHESRISKDYRHRHHSPHELLGSLAADVNRVEPRWRRFIKLEETPWLRGHVVQGQVVFPAAGYLTMAIQAIRQHSHATTPAAGVEAVRFRNVSFAKALVLSEDMSDLEITLSLRPQAQTARESSAVWHEFRIFTVTPDGKTWTEHCRGLVHAETSAQQVADDGGWWDGQAVLRRMESQCSSELSQQKLYYLGRDVGLDWRHPFDNISKLRMGCNASAATARVPEASINSPGGMGDVIHPALLDSVLFHPLCSALIFARNRDSAYVPTFIKQLRIGVNKLCTPTKPGDELLCGAATSASGGPGGNVFDVLVLQKTGDAVLLQAEGVRLTGLPRELDMSGQARDLCHGMDWVTHMDVPWTPQQRDRLCKSTVPTESLAERNRNIEALALQYVRRALDKLSAEPRLDDAIRNMPHGLRRWFEWMQTLASHTTDTSLLPETGAATPDLGAMGDAVYLLGPHLHDIVMQRTNALSLMSKDNLLSRVYTEKRVIRCYTQMAAWCKELGRHTPGLRVLEVGAGTGSTTLPILESLQGNIQRYDFTDISPGFFKAAKERLNTLGEGYIANTVEFGVLDLERGAQEQGFKEGSYDLVIASNVVHATRRIDDTLKNIRSLLKPGVGKLMLLEVTRDQLYYNLVFGAFEGWWAGYDEGRRMSPLLAPSGWVDRLKKADFVEPEPWFSDYPAKGGGTMSVFIANAAWPASEQEQQLPPIHLLTVSTSHGQLEDGPPISQELIQPLQDKLRQLTTVSAKCITTPSPGEDIVVMLPEVARLLCDGLSADSWQGFKNWMLRARVVLLVDTSSHQNNLDTGMWTGFARVIRLEHPDIRIVTLDLDLERDTEEEDLPLVLEKLTQILPVLLRSPTFDLGRHGKEVDNEFTVRDGQLFVPRVQRREVSDYVRRCSQQTDAPEMAQFLSDDHGQRRTLKAELGVQGLMETLRWKDDTEAPSLGPDDVRFELRAASINFKDVLIAAGQLEGITEMRNDCSGVVLEVGANMSERFRPGDRVCALYSRSYTNYPVVHGDCCQVVPDGMPFEEAAALPIVWATAYYSLFDMGRLNKGEKILIHSAAGAVGQAAIMLAQHLGAEVFATVGGTSGEGNEKRELLQEKYGIPASHIFSSRTTAFRTGIERLTGGYGVDVVLNSLSGEMFRESCNLIAPFGRFVEIGRKDLMDDALMPMEFLLRNVTFAYVDLALIIDQNKPLARRLLQGVAELAAAGSIRPVVLTTMPISEIETAFRLIQAGKHTGKVILTVEQGQKVMAVPPPPHQAELRPDATYAVVGGLGGLGREIISWMADHGARNILSLSRSGAKDQRSLELIQEMSARGVRLIAEKCDVTSREQVASLAQRIRDEDGMPPIRGMIQSAMVLRDTMFQNMSAEDWNLALAPKIRGTKNLDAVFGGEEKEENKLDFFVMLSSVVAVTGNVGQSNYAAACSFQDAFIRRRQRRQRVKNVNYSINVGAILEVGYVSENIEVASALRRQGLGTVSVKELLALLNHIVAGATSEAEEVSGETARESNNYMIGVMPDDKTVGLGESFWIQDRRFAHLLANHNSRASQQSAGSGASAGDDLPTLLARASSFDDAASVMCSAILQQLGKLIATPVEMLNAAQSLDSYGVDSLVAVELRNWVGAYLQANVQLMVLRGTRSIHELAKIVTKESRLVSLDTA